MPQRLAIIAILLALWGAFATACSIQAWVDANETITMQLDLDAILKQGKVDKAKMFPNGKVPPDFTLSFPFWHTQSYDLRSNPDIKKYKDKIRELRIKTLTYKITQNTLNIDIPSQGQQLDIFAAKTGTTDTQQFSPIGYIFPIPSGRTGITDRLYFSDSGETTINGFLQEYSLILGLKGNLLLDGKKNPTIPQGKLALEATLSVAFTVDIELK